MTFGKFILMIINGILGSIMVIGGIAVIISVFTMDLGTLFFGIVLIIGPAIIVSIIIRLKESSDNKELYHKP